MELPLYTLRTGRHAEAAAMLASEAAYLLAVLAAWRYNPVGATWVFVVPFFLSSFLLMFGNWSQHAFVDPLQPGDVYRSTYNCLDCPDNPRTYNDGCECARACGGVQGGYPWGGGGTHKGQTARSSDLPGDQPFAPCYALTGGPWAAKSIHP